MFLTILIVLIENLNFFHLFIRNVSPRIAKKDKGLINVLK